jgi:hypothetical protein
VQEKAIGPILKERFGNMVERMIEGAHSTEWDLEIIKNLPKLRKSDSMFDYKMACLVYYNDEISRKERDRRLDSLWRRMVNKAVDDCNALRAAPKPITWHLNDVPKLSKRMWRSIDENWDTAAEAIEDIPSTQWERRREMFKPFYDFEWTAWGNRFKRELFEYKLDDTTYGGYSEACLRESYKQIDHWNRVWQGRLAKEIEQCREKGASQDHELRMKYARSRNAGASPEELEAICQEILECTDKVEERVQKISKAWNQMDTEKKMQARFNLNAFRWLRTRDSKRAMIKDRFSRELKELRKPQEVESRDLFPPTEALDVDFPVQARPDLNQAIASALADHAVLTSPADCSFSRGYGDVPKSESTRSEKSGSKDWNLLGLRGAEAIQVSSHRGPPTDRPPDKPVETSVFAGCSEERPNWHPSHAVLIVWEAYRQPLQPMQFWGVVPLNNTAFVQLVPLTKSIGS